MASSPTPRDELDEKLLNELELLIRSYDINSATTEYARGWRTGMGRAKAEIARFVEKKRKEGVAANANH